MINNKKVLPIIIFLSIAFGFFIGRFVYKSDNIFYTQNSEYKNLRALIKIVEDNYSDQLNVFEYLTDALMIKLKTIDPYISFYDANEYNYVKDEIEGEFTGVGISYFLFNDTVLVSDVFPASPAEISGISKLDRIISFNNNDIVGLSLDSVSSLFSKYDNLSLTVLNYFTGIEKEVLIEKDVIQLSPIEYFKVDEKTVFLKINSFHSNTYPKFRNAIEDLLTNTKIKNVVLDLRNNPGGLLSSAIDVLDEFFEAGDTLTITETKEGQIETYISTSNGLLKNTDVVILINGSTASAAELVTLAMQDNDRALVIGSNSYGKGVFQQDMPVLKGNVVHVTRGKYFGPSGRWIDTQSSKLFDFDFYKTKNGRYVAAENGITPDIYNSGTHNDYMYRLFDEYCLEFIFKYKSVFRTVSDENRLYSIAQSIVDTGGVKIYNEYFEDDTLLAKTLSYSFAKYLLQKNDYLRYSKQSDSVYLNALYILENSNINDEIFKKDTLKPYSFLQEK